MTASEYMKIRLSALDGAGFSKQSVIYPGDGFTSYHLENAIKTLVRSKEVVKVDTIGMNTGVYKLVAKPAKKQPILPIHRGFQFGLSSLLILSSQGRRE